MTRRLPLVAVVVAAVVVALAGPAGAADGQVGKAWKSAVAAERATAAPQASTKAPALPASPAAAGWQLLFSETFDDPDALADWSTYDGGTDTSGHGTYAALSPPASKVVTVADGMASVRMHDGLVAALLPPVTGKAYGGQLYGRYEVVFRVAPGSSNGYKIAYLLWPDTDKWTNEVDFPESELGAGSFYAATLCPGSTTGDFCLHSEGTDSPLGEWHTAVTEWTPDALTFYMDGQLIDQTTTAVPQEPMHWVLQHETAIPDGPDPGDTAQVDIASVRAWALDA